MNKSSTIKNIVRYNVHVDEISFHQTLILIGKEITYSIASHLTGLFWSLALL